MNTNQLLTVSALGLAVNLVGMFATGHHHHGHSVGCCFPYYDSQEMANEPLSTDTMITDMIMVTHMVGLILHIRTES